MTLKKMDTSRFNMELAGDLNGSIYGVAVNQSEANIVLLPVPWEATVSYARGTASGPNAIKLASPQLDLFDPSFANLGVPNPWEYGIYLETQAKHIQTLNKQAKILSTPIIDAGGDLANNKDLQTALAKVNKMSEELNTWVYDKTKEIIDSNKIIGLIGGEHSISYGGIKALAEKHHQIGVLHIDAHADLRVAYEGFTHSHASIMYNVLQTIPQVTNITQVGIRDLSNTEFNLIKKTPKINTWLDAMLFATKAEGIPWGQTCTNIIKDLPQKVYISFDIDGLDPSLCPHTGTAVPGGLSFNEVDYLLKTLVTAGKTVVGFDVVEVAPNKRDSSDEWDGNVGARILYKLCAAALISQGAGK